MAGWLDFSRGWFDKVQALTGILAADIFWDAVPEKDRQDLPFAVLRHLNQNRRLSFGGGPVLIEYSLEVQLYAADKLEALSLLQNLAPLDGFSGELTAGGVQVVSVRQEAATTLEEGEWVRGVIGYRATARVVL